MSVLLRSVIVDEIQPASDIARKGRQGHIQAGSGGPVQNLNVSEVAERRPVGEIKG